jgi:hypothetical protein
MDAGDTNKYVTNTDDALPFLIMAYQLHPSIWSDDTNIPESGNGVPDLLDEINYEIEWLKKMQDDDGGVFIKSGDAWLTEPTALSKQDQPRYYGRKCSSSTIAAAAMYSQAAFAYRDCPSLAGQAAELSSMAEKAWEHFHANQLQTDCDDGEVLCGDADRPVVHQRSVAVRAALWLWLATGKQTYHDYFKGHYTDARPFQDGSGCWDSTTIQEEDALLFYTKQAGADTSVAQHILDAKLNGDPSNELYGFADNDLYRLPLPDGYLWWGSNGIISNYGNMNTNLVEYNLKDNPASYRQCALETVHWLHGVNGLGKVMLSNMYEQGAENSVNEFYHLWFADGSDWDSLLEPPFVGPPPGFLVGGANRWYGGNRYPPAGEPPAKSYADFNDVEGSAWEITENSITYQGPYIRLLAYFVANTTP